MPTSSLIAMAGAVPAIDPLVRLVQRCLQALGHAAHVAGGPQRVQFFTAQMQRMSYTIRKPKGPVPEKRQTRRGCNPHLQAGFCHAQIPGAGATASAQHGYGWDGANGNAARTSSGVFFTSCPPYAMKTQTVDFLDSPEGIQSMTAITTAIRSATPATAQAAIPADHLSTVLGAFNAANLASSYIERGNCAAARRKLVLALQAINQLQAEA